MPKTVFTPQPLMAYRDAKSVSIYRREPDGTCGPEVAEIVLETIEVDNEEEALEYAMAEARLMAAAFSMLTRLKELEQYIAVMINLAGSNYDPTLGHELTATTKVIQDAEGL